MSKIRRIDFSPDEWIAGTRDLGLDERGAYWDVCSLMYSRGGPIADDDAWIAKTLGCHGRTWRTIKVRLLALGKLRIEGGCVTNGRAMRELIHAENRLKSSRKASEKSAKSRRTRAENADESNDYNEIPEADAPAAERAIHQPSTIKVSKKEDVGSFTVTAPAGAGADERGHRAGSQKARAEPRGTRLPDGWQPGPEAERFARDLGLDPTTTTAEFADFWRAVPGAKGRKLDWDATYRNRCRDIAGRKNVNGTRHVSRHAEPDTSIVDGINAALARRPVQPG